MNYLIVCCYYCFSLQGQQYQIALRYCLFTFDLAGKPMRTYAKYIGFLIAWLIICSDASPGELMQAEGIKKFS